MVNAAAYRWKKMIGPRDRRPPYRGFWYPHSTNGRGIVDFLDLCEAAGFLGILAILMTSCAMVAGMVAMALGLGEKAWPPPCACVPSRSGFITWIVTGGICSPMMSAQILPVFCTSANSS
jgi:hypothetical protein